MGGRSSVADVERAEERWLRRMAAAATVIAAGWLVFAVVTIVHHGPDHHFVIVAMIGASCMLLAPRARRQPPKTLGRNEWCSPFFMSLGCCFELTHATGVPLVVKASAPVF